MDIVVDRSFEPISSVDLQRLDQLARDDLADLFSRLPRYAVYQDRILLVCLCQGAAQHWVDQTNGVKDFDVWVFLHAHPTTPFPAKRIGHKDFGASSFGRSQQDAQYAGRRVDILGRSILHADGSDIRASVLAWLHGRTESAQHLRKRPLIILPTGEPLYLPLALQQD
jgi:hypothetical protein